MKTLSNKLFLILLTFLMMNLYGCTDIKKKEEWELKRNIEFYNSSGMKYGDFDWRCSGEEGNTYYKFNLNENPNKILVPERFEKTGSLDNYYRLRIDWPFPEVVFWEQIPSLNYSSDHNDIVNIISPSTIKDKPSRLRRMLGVLDDKGFASLVLEIRATNDSAHVINISLSNLLVACPEKVSWKKDPYGETFEYRHSKINDGSFNFNLLVNSPVPISQTDSFLRPGRAFLFVILWLIIVGIFYGYFPIFLFKKYFNEDAGSDLFYFIGIGLMGSGSLFIMFNDANSLCILLSKLVLGLAWYYKILLMIAFSSFSGALLTFSEYLLFGKTAKIKPE